MSVNIDESFLYFCRIGNVGMVRHFLDLGVSARIYDDDALRIASEHGHAEVVKVLLDAGANARIWNDYALRWASQNGHVEVVKVLLDAGANVRAMNDDELRCARTEEIRTLLQNHVNEKT